jgi:DNA-binding SARP family transcriptional activator
MLGSFRVMLGESVVGGGTTLGRLTAGADVVKLLALTPDHRLHKDQIADTLWPDPDGDAASKKLEQALSSAREALAGRQAPAERRALFKDAQWDMRVLPAECYFWSSLVIDVEEFAREASVDRTVRAQAA